MKYEVAIVADDFSSVTDCGVQFSKKGISTAALMYLPDELPDAELISIDTDSRPLTKAQAYNKTYKIAAALSEAGCRRVYKSIDSTMRGNIGSEIDAAMDAFGFKTAILTPAFPHYGRQVIDGVHYLNGVKINESMIGKDPVTPVTKSKMTEILEDQTVRQLGSISLSELREGAEKCARYAEKLFEEGAEILIFDSETEDDLKIVADIAYYLKDSLVCGSTGLAQYMADGLKLSNPQYKDSFRGNAGRLIFAAASASPVSRKQIEVLTAQSDTYPIELDIMRLMDELNADTKGADTYLSMIDTAFAARRDVALYLDSTDEGRKALLRKAEGRGIEKDELSKFIVKLMAELVKRATDKGEVAGILMTGGDTAKAICDRLGAYGMELETEAEAGIPMGRLLGPDNIIACIKAGAFGSESAMLTARDKMNGTV